MSDIFKEVKHELQQEKLHLVIKKHYKGVIALIILILLSTCVYVYIREEHIRENEEMSKEYYKLFLSENRIGTVKESDFGKLIDFQKSIYSTFAKMQYVNFLSQAKKPAEAIQLLFHLIDFSNEHPEIANLAKIRAAELVMKYKLTAYNFKVSDILQKVIKRDNTVPYFYISKLILGQLLIEDGKQDQAFPILKDLSADNSTPENIRFFSNAILENYLQ